MEEKKGVGIEFMTEEEQDRVIDGLKSELQTFETFSKVFSLLFLNGSRLDGKPLSSALFMCVSKCSNCPP